MKVTALAQRSGDWWAVEVPEVDGAFTQAKRLDQIPEMVADAVGLLLDVAPATVEVEVEAHLNDEALERYVHVTREAQEFAAEASQRASLASRAAVDVLRSSAYSTRDVAALLGVSHQRVSQIGAGFVGPSRDILEQLDRALTPIRRIQQQVAALVSPMRELSDSTARTIEEIRKSNDRIIRSVGVRSISESANRAVAPATRQAAVAKKAAGPAKKAATPAKKAAGKKHELRKSSSTAAPVKRAASSRSAPAKASGSRSRTR